MAVTLIDTAQIQVSHNSVVLTVPAGGVPVDATVVVAFAVGAVNPPVTTVTDTGGNSYADQNDGSGSKLFVGVANTPLAQNDTIVIDYGAGSRDATGAVAFYATGLPNVDQSVFLSGTDNEVVNAVGPATVAAGGIAVGVMYHFNTVLGFTEDGNFTGIAQAIAIDGATRRGVTVSYREASGTYLYDPTITGTGFRGLSIAALGPAVVPSMGGGKSGRLFLFF